LVAFVAMANEVRHEESRSSPLSVRPERDRGYIIVRRVTAKTGLPGDDAKSRQMDTIEPSVVSVVSLEHLWLRYAKY
jgi:hypothetical protein